MIRVIHAGQAPQLPLPFSHAIQAGDFVYVSGQVGVNPATGKPVGSTIEEQTEQALANVAAILAAAGLTLEHVVKMNVFIQDRPYSPGYNQVYERVMKAPYPARTTAISGIGHLIEIDCIAYTKARRDEVVGKL